MSIVHHNKVVQLHEITPRPGQETLNSTIDQPLPIVGSLGPIE